MGKEFKISSIRKLKSSGTWRHNETRGLITNGHFFLFTKEPLDYFRGMLDCDVHQIDDVESIVTQVNKCSTMAVVSDRLNEYGELFRILETGGREVKVDERYYQTLCKGFHDIFSCGDVNGPLAITAWVSEDEPRKVIGGIMPAKQMELDLEEE